MKWENICFVLGCEPKMFEKMLELRECRLDLEEQLLEEKKHAEFLKKECDNLLKKVKSSSDVLVAPRPLLSLTSSLLWGFAEEISEEQSTGSRGGLGASQQRETAENEQTTYSGSS